MFFTNQIEKTIVNIQTKQEKKVSSNTKKVYSKSPRQEQACSHRVWKDVGIHPISKGKMVHLIPNKQVVHR